MEKIEYVLVGCYGPLGFSMMTENEAQECNKILKAKEGDVRFWEWMKV